MAGVGWRCETADVYYGNTMSKALLVSKVFFAAGIALSVGSLAVAAGSPFDGTWKIDDSKSSWSDGKFPPNMSLTINVAIANEEMTYHSANDTAKDKPPAKLDYVAKINGKMFPMQGTDRFNQVSVRRLGKTKLEILECKDGDVIVGAYWEVSADGKHLMRWGIGKSPEGKSKAYEEFFDKK